MIRRQINFLMLSMDNVLRRWKIYLMMIFAVAIGTAIIIFLFMFTDGLKRTAHSSLMLLPLNKIWVKPATSDNAQDAILLTSDVIAGLQEDTGIVKVWPQVDYCRSAYVELVIDVGIYRRDFGSMVEVYGVKEEFIQEGLFKDCSFSYSPREEVPIVFPESVVNMLNHSIAQKLNMTFPKETITGFNVNLHLKTDRALSSEEFKLIQCRVVGTSMTIPQIGVAVPLEALKEWNRSFGGKKGGAEYSRVLIEAENPEKASRLSAELEEQGYLIESSRKTFNSIQNIFSGVNFAVVVLGLLIIISVGIGLFNGLNLVVFSERDMIGVMRAVGAKRIHILEIMMLQVVFIGLVGGVLGTGFAFLTAFGIEDHIISLMNKYTLTIESPFRFNGLLFAGGGIIPPLVCLVFGIIPALHAVTLKPQDALK